MTTVIFHFIKNLSRTDSIQDKRKHYRDNFNFYLRDAVSAVLATAMRLPGWLADWVVGWVTVRHTRRYCIKTRSYQHSSGGSLNDNTVLILFATTLIFDSIKNLSCTNSIQDKRENFFSATTNAPNVFH